MIGREWVRGESEWGRVSESGESEWGESEWGRVRESGESEQSGGE